MTTFLHHAQSLLAHFPLANANLKYAFLLVNGLAAAGLEAVCIAPGSRSTPLTLAFSAHPKIKSYVHLDERSAGFFALGMALASDKPVALVCTSGTAAANFYPAVIEAYQSQVPLLVLTADRPPELRHSGANQTIDQVKMYGSAVLWAVDLDVPSPDSPEVALRNVVTTADRAYHTANGLHKGAVQINLPFRKPLEPTAEEWSQYINFQQESWSKWQATPSPLPGRLTPTLAPAEAEIDQLAQVIQHHEQGLIVCGPRCPGGDFPEVVAQLAQAAGYPILADPLSGVRFGPWVEKTAVVGAYETFWAQNNRPGGLEPTLILQFGQVPTGNWVNQYLTQQTPAVRLHIRRNGQWADDSHRITHFWQADEVILCQQLGQKLPGRVSHWLTEWQKLEQKSWQGLETHWPPETWDVSAILAVLEQLPAGAQVVVGNSLPIRHVDQFARPGQKRLTFYGNRGASGIDGNISTALGVAAAHPTTPTLLIIGDVTFYHDLNGLLAFQQQQIKNLSILLLNNGGGGIFNRLPLAPLDPPFTKLFLTPHGLDFSQVCQMYGLAHRPLASLPELEMALQGEWLARPTVLEFFTNSREDEQIRRQVVKKVL